MLISQPLLRLRPGSGPSTGTVNWASPSQCPTGASNLTDSKLTFLSTLFLLHCYLAQQMTCYPQRHKIRTPHYLLPLLMIVLHIQIVTKFYRLYFLNLIGMHLLNYSQGHLKSTSISYLDLCSYFLTGLSVSGFVPLQVFGCHGTSGLEHRLWS